MHLETSAAGPYCILYSIYVRPSEHSSMMQVTPEQGVVLHFVAHNACLPPHSLSEQQPSRLLRVPPASLLL